MPPRGKYVPPALRNRQNNDGDNDRGDSNENSSNNNFNNRSGGRRDFPSSFSSGRGRFDREEGRQGGGNFNNRGGGRGGRWNDRNVRGKPDINRRNKELERKMFGDPEKRVKSGIDFNKYDNIEVEVTGPDKDSPPEEPFNDWKESNLHPIIQSNIELAGYFSPTPVQKYAIPNVVKKRDIMSCAQTGSGKTAGFLLPIIQNFLALNGNFPVATPDGHSRRPKIAPLGLVMAPTRELAIQIQDESKKFMYRTGLRSCVVYGGQQMGIQMRDLENGVCDLVIATPGRLWDMIERGKISLEICDHLVLDEADRMLDMGFEHQIRDIVERTDMPSRKTRTTCMFSATFPPEIQKLAGDFLGDYVFLAIGRVGSATENITQKVVYCERDSDKNRELLECLSKSEGLTLVFVETKRNADWLERELNQYGIEATSIHGDRTQYDREEALEMFRCGRCPVLVATSVAARGLDIPNVKCVINYDVPGNRDDYVHRIGRTGRAGHHGEAIAFVNQQTKILQDILEIMEESSQEVEEWFKQLVKSQRSYRRSGGGGGRKKGGFGGRDARLGKSGGNRNQTRSNNSSNSNSGWGGGNGGGNYRSSGGGGNSRDAW